MWFKILMVWIAFFYMIRLHRKSKNKMWGVWDIYIYIFIHIYIHIYIYTHTYFLRWIKSFILTSNITYLWIPENITVIFFFLSEHLTCRKWHSNCCSHSPDMGYLREHHLPGNKFPNKSTVEGELIKAAFPSQSWLAGEEKAFSFTVHNFPKNQLKIHLYLPELIGN